MKMALADRAQIRLVAIVALLVGGGFLGVGAVSAHESGVVGTAGSPDAKWIMTGSMATPRSFFTATLLEDGRVLVAGGWNGADELASAELYDPVDGSWSSAESMISPREGHAAALLPDGSVLVSGGQKDGGAVRSAEIYNPRTDRWRATTDMLEIRTSHVLTPVTINGEARILASSGSNVCRGCEPVTSAELFDPSLPRGRGRAR